MLATEGAGRRLKPATDFLTSHPPGNPALPRTSCPAATSDTPDSPLVPLAAASGLLLELRAAPKVLSETSPDSPPRPPPPALTWLVTLPSSRPPGAASSCSERGSASDTREDAVNSELSVTVDDLASAAMLFIPSKGAARRRGHGKDQPTTTTTTRALRAP